MESKPGLKSKTIIEGLIIAFMIVLTILILSFFSVKEVWPASIALLFFFEGKASIANLKNIFIGGSVGILLALALVKLAGLLMPSMGEELGMLIPVFIFIFLIIVLGDISHVVFNNYAFCYFTVALIAKQQATVSWLIGLIVGGGFLIGGVILFIRLMKKNESEEKAANSNL
ncbi:hypothetical protein GOM49_05420 [Clostridium bovifaecis]|uniref:DUF1097 domain-containing protein n=1 Tax=Clostridium bovifaecis TaxID=2184719 RepID=A0A6I6FA60_9CLOT|nr:hypothetical protein GOM49_05420 [Clostridium bovifaecis]